MRRLKAGARVASEALRSGARPGTLVSELASGKQYHHAQVTDQMIADQVAVARRLAGEQGEQPATGASARMVFAACLAALAAGGMIAYRIKRRRRAA